ncbi:MAG: glycosyltransferase [Devosia nanyangense]|uniref:Glycosyltransferase n=1 Tax=Devosia nanyangense TaxID=1228055 RepID=A0A933NXN5_9HYPH|nr:glycosyltransferase [Devosia nanyangense]
MAHAVARPLDPDKPSATPLLRDRVEGDAFHLAVAKVLLHRKKLSLSGFAAALRQQAETGSDLAHIIIAGGLVRPMDYYKAVASVYQLPFVNLQLDPIDDTLADIHDRVDYSDRNLIPWRMQAGRLCIATTSITPEQFEWADARYGANTYDFVITSPFDILWQTGKLFRAWDTFFAREALNSWKPEHSAKETLNKPQVLGLIGILIALTAGLVFAASATLVTLMAVATTIYTLTFLFKFILTFVGSSRRADMQISPEAIAEIDDRSLPIYTVLVPMYREANVLALLVSALKKLDYPASKLEVKLVLEEDDHETIDVAKGLRLPGSFEIVRVPPSEPRTKPKACNYALQFCRGEFITIYDAEDQPEPDQMKKAVLAFRTSGERLACVQARLNYFNRSENWLTGMFTLEYSQWFDFLLPGLDWMKVPIPLGGTSNHFKLAALRQVGAWDPYNVTEDADLGIRLAQEGFTVGIINSTTYEEANGFLPSWVYQRSRWIKGYMQTWLVHMRHPVRLWQTIGAKGFFSFQFFVGAPPFTMLLAPIMWVITALVWLTHSYDFGWLFPEPIGTMALFNLMLGNLFLVYFGVVAALKRRYYDLVLPGVLMPVYWVLHSLASYKALWQLIVAPHYWEKTEHGLSKVTQERMQAEETSAR